MKFLSDIWAWLNGNKTTIGAVILALVAREGDLFGSPELEAILEWAGGILAGGGLVHKIKKGINNT